MVEERSAMLHYLVRRIVAAVPVLVIVSMLAFAGMQLVTGGPIYAYLGTNPESNDLSGEQLRQLKHQFGWDQPLPVRYAKWVGRALHGDFGSSICTKQPVTEAI